MREIKKVKRSRSIENRIWTILTTFSLIAALLLNPSCGNDDETENLLSGSNLQDSTKVKTGTDSGTTSVTTKSGTTTGNTSGNNVTTAGTSSGPIRGTTTY
jgi:hypothetical protein